MQMILFEDYKIWDFLPFTYTRPFAALRIGIDTIYEKWKYYLPDIKLVTRYPLSEKFNDIYTETDTLFINSRFLPTPNLLHEIHHIEKNTILTFQGEVVVFRCEESIVQEELIHRPLSYERLEKFKQAFDEEQIGDVSYIFFNKIADLFQKNGQLILMDFVRLTQNKTSFPLLDPYTKVYSPENIFIEEGVELRCAVLNASKGPIYIGKHAEIQENSVIIGPCAIGEHAVINIGAKIRGETTIGPYCKVGGEVSNSVFLGFSNKAHDGFVGNSYIGEWCNLGADTNTSNLKNNYSNVKIYSEHHQTFVDTGTQFCGTFMGDHSKTGINTMLNTGSVVGVCANIFGGDFPPKFIPSFSWGGADGFQTFQLEKAFEVAEKMMKRRNIPFTEKDKKILSFVFQETAKFRTW